MHDSREKKIQTKIELKKMTLSPKAVDGSAPIQPQTTVASEGNVGSLWGGRTMDEQPDPWGHGESGLPDLPGQYGSPSKDDDNAPF